MNAQTAINVPTLALLREPFAPNHISKLPKPTKQQTDMVKADFKKGTRCQICGSWHHPDVNHLDYVGHAALTDRLLDTDPEWFWEPVAFNAEGLPAFDRNGGLWIKLTVLGVSRLGYGHAGDKAGGDAIKEIIGDALRNAAMRFGAALDLWHKGDLHAEEDAAGGQREKAQGEPPAATDDDRAPRGRNRQEGEPSKNELDTAEKELVSNIHSCADASMLDPYLKTAVAKHAFNLLRKWRPSAIDGPAPEDCPEYVPIAELILNRRAEFARAETNAMALPEYIERGAELLRAG